MWKKGLLFNSFTLIFSPFLPHTFEPPAPDWHEASRDIWPYTLWGCSGEVSQDTLLIPVTVPPRLGWASVLPCPSREGERSAGVAVPLEMEEAVLQRRGRGREPRFLGFRARTRSIGDISGGLLQVARDNLWSWHCPLRASKPGILSFPCL